MIFKGCLQQAALFEREKEMFFKQKSSINTYIVAGLGNPGKEYVNTRHNVGFMVIDELALRLGVGSWEKKHKALIGKAKIGADRVILVKPQTYMNLSGESIRSVCDYYKVNPDTNLIVISDDINLMTGQLRIREKGSAGGHNGLKNIIQHLSSEGFTRLRMGVGEKIAGQDLKDHVLGHFGKEDLEVINAAVKDAADAVTLIINDGVDKAANKYNKKVKE